MERKLEYLTYAALFVVVCGCFLIAGMTLGFLQNEGADIAKQSRAQFIREENLTPGPCAGVGYEEITVDQGVNYR
jgi:hypothetical protein